jgi:serine/threonine protein kinase/tetratricopeptide (TPR) repeat protein
MIEPRHRRAEALFDELVVVAPDLRSSMLAERCAGDVELRTLVEQLLGNDDSGMGKFLRAPLPAAELLAPAVPAQIGNYQLLGEIGRGGAGVVYEARQHKPARIVALKVLNAVFASAEMLQRFAHEAEVLGELQHPGIAQIYEAGAVEMTNSLGLAVQTPYFAMERVDGSPITAYCDSARLTIRERLALFVKVCRAVQYAHSRGVIHRDLTPNNVLAGLQDNQLFCKIIDFGIAKLIQPRRNSQGTITQVNQLVGTPEYMSPEQAAGSRDVDTRTDVYSLGALLYQLLSGAPPVDSRSLREAPLAQLQRMLCEFEPPAPSVRVAQMQPAELAAAAGQRGVEPQRLGAMLRGELDWIVLRAIEKDPSRRYESPGNFAADVERYLNEQAVEAAPPGAAYRVRKFMRRNRVMVMTGTAVAATLVIGVIGTTIGLVWAVREQRRTEEQRIIAKREADQARTVNEFMRAVLTSVEPGNRGADVRLIDVLSAASGSAAQRFADHPLQEAQIRDLLGEVYNNLSLFSDSKVEYQRSLALWQQHAGFDDPRALSVELHCAGVALNMLQVREAEQIVTALQPRLERILGPDDMTTLETRRCAAIIHRMSGRLDDAERILLELRVHPKLANDDRMQVLVLQSLMGLYLARPVLDDPAQRAAFLDQVTLIGRERAERALRLYGPHSDATLQAQATLAWVLYAQDDFRAAIELSRTILANSAERLGDCHAVRREVMMTLAFALGRLGEIPEPADLCLQSIQCTRQQSPSNGMALVIVISDSLRYLDRAGRAQEGETLSRELLASLLNVGGHGDMILDAEAFVADFVSMAARIDEADALFEALLAREGSYQDPRSAARFHRIYAAHLKRAARFEQAEQHLTRAVNLLGDVRRGTYGALPDELIVEFISLYEACGNREKAAKYARLLAEMRTDSR